MVNLIRIFIIGVFCIVAILVTRYSYFTQNKSHYEQSWLRNASEEPKEQTLVSYPTFGPPVPFKPKNSTIIDLQPFFSSSELELWRSKLYKYMEGVDSDRPEEAMMSELAGRLQRARKQCSVGSSSAPSINDTDKLPPVLLELIPDHNLLYCQIPKVGTNFVRGNLKVLDILYHSNKYKTAYLANSRVLTNRYEVKINNMHVDPIEKHNERLIFTTVRHPIRRVFSTFCNKVIQTGYRMGIFKPDLSILDNPLAYVKKFLPNYRLLSDNEFSQSYNEIMNKGSSPLFIRRINYPSNTKIGTNGGQTKHLHVTDRANFPQFVLWTTVNILRCKGNRNCLLKINSHLVPESAMCDPCRVNFDVIMKLESLTEEFNLLRDYFHIPILDDQVLKYQSEKTFKYKVVVNKKNGDKTFKLNESASYCAPYEYFMAHLSQLHLDLLYTAYYEDLQMFGYKFSD